MQTAIKTFVKAVLAGISVGFGAIAYISIENKTIGALLFALGIFTIYTFGFNLFTGKVCYIPNMKPSYLLTVGIVYIGNLAGTFIIANAYRLTRLEKYVEYTVKIVEGKYNETIASLFILGILCGLLMCVAVVGFAIIENSVGKYIAMILPIVVFIVAGFEHSIANMFYLSFAGVVNADIVIKTLVISLGNLIGGGFFPLIIRLCDGKKLGIDK